METVAYTGMPVWAGLMIQRGGPTLQHFVTEGLQSVVGTHNGAVHQELTLKKFVEKSPMGEIPCWMSGTE